jgi:RNA polymerase sigma-70 factor (ECF subfamily)
VVEAERQDRVLSAIQGLPAIYREPFVLRHLNDWSYQQIADLMGLPVDSVETRLVRARRLLREALAREAG